MNVPVMHYRHDFYMKSYPRPGFEIKGHILQILERYMLCVAHATN